MQEKIKAALTEVTIIWRSDNSQDLRTVLVRHKNIPNFRLIILLSSDIFLNEDDFNEVYGGLSEDERSILAVVKNQIAAQDGIKNLAVAAEHDQADIISSLDANLLRNPEIANLMLINALGSGMWNISTAMLQIIPNFNYQDRCGNSILNYLAMRNDIDEERIDDFIRLLESKDKSQVESLIRASSLSDETALHHAVRNENAPMIKWLITRGIDVSKCNLQGRTALDLAVINDKPKTVLTLLKSYSSIGILNEATAIYLKQGISKNGNIVIKEVSIMQWAVICHAFALSSYLLEQGLNINIFDEQNVTLLHHAARYAGVDAVRYLVSKGLNIDAVDDFGKTALHYAAESGSVDMIDYLVEQGLDINANDIKNKTIINYATQSGRVDAVRYLVSKGVNVNVVNNGITPLHYAAGSGSVDLVRYLFEQGVNNINAADKLGKTPLHYAAESGSIDLVRYLFEQGVNNINAADKLGKTALHYAVEFCSIDIVDYLVKKGANINPADKLDKTSLHYAAELGDVDLVLYLIEKNTNIYSTDKCAKKVIHYAVESGNVDLVKMLIEKFWGVNHVDSNNRTALHYAVEFNNLDMVKLLISKYASLDIMDTLGKKALHYAVKGGNLDIVSCIIKDRYVTYDELYYELFTAVRLVESDNKASIFECLCDKMIKAKEHNQDYKKTLHYAAEFGSLDTVKHLLAKGGCINDLDLESKTALHYAAKYCRSDIVNYLIGQKANVNVLDNMYKTALHYAAEFGVLDTIKNLVSNVDDVNAADQLGKTALHYAAESGNIDVVKCLIGGGAKVNAADQLGKTALHYAAVSNNVAVIKYLIEQDIAVDDYDKTEFKTLSQANNHEITRFIERKERYQRYQYIENIFLHIAKKQDITDKGAAILANNYLKDTDINPSEKESLKALLVSSILKVADVSSNQQYINIAVKEVIVEFYLQLSRFDEKALFISRSMADKIPKKHDASASSASFTGRVTEERESQAEEMQQHGR
jgi:ankyrin repeat protein